MEATWKLSKPFLHSYRTKLSYLSLEDLGEAKSVEVAKHEENTRHQKMVTSAFKSDFIRTITKEFQPIESYSRVLSKNDKTAIKFPSDEEFQQLQSSVASIIDSLGDPEFNLNRIHSEYSNKPVAELDAWKSLGDALHSETAMLKRLDESEEEIKYLETVMLKRLEIKNLENLIANHKGVTVTKKEGKPTLIKNEEKPTLIENDAKKVSVKEEPAVKIETVADTKKEGKSESAIKEECTEGGSELHKPTIVKLESELFKTEPATVKKELSAVVKTEPLGIKKEVPLIKEEKPALVKNEADLIAKREEALLDIIDKETQKIRDAPYKTCIKDGWLADLLGTSCYWHEEMMKDPDTVIPPKWKRTVAKIRSKWDVHENIPVPGGAASEGELHEWAMNHQDKFSFSEQGVDHGAILKYQLDEPVASAERIFTAYPVPKVDLQCAAVEDRAHRNRFIMEIKRRARVQKRAKGSEVRCDRWVKYLEEKLDGYAGIRSYKLDVPHRDGFAGTAFRDRDSNKSSSDEERKAGKGGISRKEKEVQDLLAAGLKIPRHLKRHYNFKHEEYVRRIDNRLNQYGLIQKRYGQKIKNRTFAMRHNFRVHSDADKRFWVQNGWLPEKDEWRTVVARAAANGELSDIDTYSISAASSIDTGIEKRERERHKKIIAEENLKRLAPDDWKVHNAKWLYEEGMWPKRFVKPQGIPPHRWAEYSRQGRQRKYEKFKMMNTGNPAKVKSFEEPIMYHRQYMDEDQHRAYGNRQTRSKSEDGSICTSDVTCSDANSICSTLTSGCYSRAMLQCDSEHDSENERIIQKRANSFCKLGILSL